MRAALAILGLLCAPAGVAQGTAPELPLVAEASTYGLGAGRFEVIAPPGGEGLRLARLAEAAWESWRGSLALPERIRNGVLVRLAPAEDWGFAPEPGWQVVAEPGGVVTLWIRGGGPEGTEQERVWLSGLAAGALQRQAMALGIGPERRTAPSWLMRAAAEEVLVRGNPAMHDAWRQAVQRAGEMPGLRATLLADYGTTDERLRRLAAFGLWQWLRAESGRGPAWPQFVADLLAGVSPGLALVQAFESQFGMAEAAELELAWQVGLAAQARLRAIPLFEPGETRRLLEQADRIVVLAPAQSRDEQALRLAELWQARDDPWLASARAVRLNWLTLHFRRMHPFYRNAAGSLGRVFIAQTAGDAGGWALALEDWRRDLETGRELERASAALLDEATR